MSSYDEVKEVPRSLYDYYDLRYPRYYGLTTSYDIETVNREELKSRKHAENYGVGANRMSDILNNEKKIANHIVDEMKAIRNYCLLAEKGIETLDFSRFKAMLQDIKFKAGLIEKK